MENGVIEYECTKCHSVKKIDTEIDPLAHDWKDWNTTKESTCTETGQKERECNLCGEKQIELVDMKEHSWIIGERVEPDCLHAGSESSECSECGKKQVVILPVLTTHDWGPWRTILEPTYTNAGYEERVCRLSDEHRELRVLPRKAKLNQSMSAGAAKKTIKKKSLKKKAKAITPISVWNAQGDVTYTVVGGNAKSKKTLKVNAYNGVVTVKKKAKKGTYSVYVNVTASGNYMYNAASTTVLLKVKVK